MSIYALQHVPFEDLGLIQEWKSDIQYIEMFHDGFDCKFPKISEIDFLIILGGPMSVNDSFPWLKAEKKFISQVISAKKPILGICLGAQILAELLGGQVYPGSEKEIGWWSIHKKALKNSELFKEFPEKLTVFQWHGDTFDLPENVESIYEGTAVKNQCFCYDEHIVGLQFHIELSEKDIERLIKMDKNYITPDDVYVQSIDEMKQQSIPTENKQLLFQLLDSLYTSKK